jgi:hypothetical protein
MGEAGTWRTMIGVRTMGIETRFASTFSEDPGDDLSVDPSIEDEVRDVAPVDDVDASWDETVAVERFGDADDFDDAAQPELEPALEPEPELEPALLEPRDDA